MGRPMKMPFGRVDEESPELRLLPVGCILLVVLCWGRYAAADVLGFDLVESIVVTGFALALRQIILCPSAFIFIFGVFLWLSGLFLFAETSLHVPMGARGFLASGGLGEVSPHSAIIIALLGIGLSVVSKRHRRPFQGTLVLVSSAIGFAISGVALWGHMYGVASAYTWGKFEPLTVSGSVLYLLASLMLFVAGRGVGEKSERPSSRSLVVALGLGGAVAATLVIGASMSDIDNRRASVISAELTSLRRAIHVQQEVLIKAMRKLGSVLSERPKGSELGSQEILRELRFIRAIGSITNTGNEIVTFPGAVDFDRGVLLTLAEDLRSGGRSIESKVLKRGDTWRITVVVPGQGQADVVFAVIDARELFFDILSNVPDQMNVTISYLSQEIAFQGERQDREHNPANRAEVHELVLPFLGWPGWCVSITPGTRFDEVHALSGVFKVPLLLLITLSALAWAWGVGDRATKGKVLVDDIKRSAGELQRENVRWASALEEVADAAVLCDTNEKVEFYNRAARVLFGKKLEKSGCFLSDILSPESSSSLRTSVLPQVRGSGRWEGAVGIISRDDNVRTALARVVPTLSSADGFIGFVLILPQMTNGKTAVSAKPESGASLGDELQQVIDGSEVPMWLAGRDGTIQFGNRKLLDFLGVSLEHFQRGWPLEFCHRDDVTGFVAAGARLGTHRRRLQNAAGVLRWFSESITAVRGSDGDVRQYIGTMVDCSRELRFEEVARSLRDEITILGHMQRSVWWIHDLGRRKVTAISDGFEDLWGISADEVLLQPEAWVPLTKPEVTVPDGITEKGIQYEYSITRDDGLNVPVIHNVYHVSWSDGVESEKHLVHIVERKNDEQRGNIASSSVRELRGELEHLYAFLASNVHDAAYQVGTLGRTLSQHAKDRGDETISSEAMQLQFESERLLTWVHDYVEIAEIISQPLSSGGASIIKALEHLNQRKNEMPPHISFSGDLGVSLPIAVEALQLAMRSIAIFVADRRGNRIPADIKVIVKRSEEVLVIECNLGDLPLSAAQLSRSFLPGGFTHAKGRVAPSLAAINALARRGNGRAWLSSGNAGRVVLHIQLRPE